MKYKMALSAIALIGLISLAYNYADNNCYKPLEELKEQKSSLINTVQDQNATIAKLTSELDKAEVEIKNLTSTVNLLNIIGEQYEEENITSGVYTL